MQSEKSQLIPEGSTLSERPFDPEPLGHRECGNCACYFQMGNPALPGQPQGFCRRFSPDLQELRGLQPRRDPRSGEVVMGKDNQPVMEPAKTTGYIFKPATRQGICFDGWRPLGTLPGEQPISTLIRSLAPQLRPVIEKCPPDLQAVLMALIGAPPQGTN